MVTDPPGAAPDQCAPRSLDVRYSYPARPDPPASVDPEAITVSDASRIARLLPPDAVGSDGGVVSIIAVVAPDTADHADACARLSTDRNSTSVVPSAEIVAAGPATGADHVVPPSVDVWYS